MTQLRTGFTVNGNALPDRDRLVSWVASARPTTMLVMDDKPLALELYVMAQGETKVGHRQYDPAEGAEWKAKSAAQYVSEVTSQLDPRLYVQVLNEPAINTDELPGLLRWLIEVMDELYKRGYRGVIGNFPMGQITQAQVESGLFDNFLIASAKYRGWHVIGIHEYTAVVRYFGVGQWPFFAATPTEYFLNPANHEQYKWPTKEDLPCVRINGALPPYWHIRRADWLTIRAREIGISEAPEYWVTESGYDNMQDVAEVFPALVDKWGIAPGYDNLRGFNSLANVWGAYWGTEWTFDMAAFEQEKWLHEECYPVNYIGWNNFMWTSDQWRRDGFDMSQNLQFQSLLADYAAALRTPPGPDPLPDPDPPPESPLTLEEWLRVIGLAFGLCIISLILIVSGIIVLSNWKQIHASSLASGGYNTMDMNALLQQLFAIPAFAVVSYTAGIVWFLVEMWKRYIVARLPEKLRAAPETVAMILIGLFMAVHGLAVEYQYDTALKEVAQFITDLVNVLGPYVLGGVATSAVTNYAYNKLRDNGVPGFNAENLTRK
jgi:hypothetical protein